MKFLLIVSAILVVAAGSKGPKPVPRWGFSIPLNFPKPVAPKPAPAPAPVPVPAPVAPAPVPAPSPVAPASERPPGKLSEDNIEAVASLFSQYPQLQGMENQIINNKPQATALPMSGPVSSLPEQVQIVLNTLATMVQSGQPLDMNKEITFTAPK